MASKGALPPWRVVPRPLLETALNDHAFRHRVAQPLILHGPRGTGKSTLLRRLLLHDWSTAPHSTAFLDLSPNSPLSSLRQSLNSSLESLALRAVRLGSISSRDILAVLHRRRGVRAALRRVLGEGADRGGPTSLLWTRAVVRYAGDGVSDGLEAEVDAEEEAAYMREAIGALRVAKEVVGMHLEWRREAIREMRRTGRFSRSLADACTDWPCLLLELLSRAAEPGHFQPKLVINNIDAMRKADSDDDSIVSSSIYHDSFLWRLIALGVNEWCLPVILATSDGYYSYQAFLDFGYPDIFVSRETFGWTPAEAKIHMVPDFFSEAEWKVIDEVLGSNQCHLNELYTLKGSSNFQKFTEVGTSNFEDIVDMYLAYLQVTIVNPAMQRALVILQNFVTDVKDGKVPETKLAFGAPWRHPPHSREPAASLLWARIQLMDFIQSLVNTGFGVNYLADSSFEIFDDPCMVAMLEVGLLYTQRDPSFIRPVSRGILRCLIRWLVEERMRMSLGESALYFWQRIVRGRSYRHLLKEKGYRK